MLRGLALIVGAIVLSVRTTRVLDDPGEPWAASARDRYRRGSPNAAAISRPVIAAAHLQGDTAEGRDLVNSDPG
jgi:hypothetical protein